MKVARLTWALAAMAATWAADKIRPPGTRPCWIAPRFTYEEQD